MIPGTGGLRKMRYAAEASGGGKRGGARVCYFLIAAASHVYLVMAFAKNEKQNLSQRDVRTVRKLLAAIRESYL
ncbi:MAG TPA: type II toxin-antitoxin system RelE/ParE family toxin [Phycisphaerae bacterium]|nr:type II toxin-antitoxin system RelE/ParE family toxin [Phycisphaerae bacterium]